MDVSAKAGGLKKGLTVVVLDPHNGVIRADRTSEVVLSLAQTAISVLERHIQSCSPDTFNSMKFNSILIIFNNTNYTMHRYLVNVLPPAVIQLAVNVLEYKRSCS